MADDRWRDFWAGSTDPMHGDRPIGFFELLADELRLIVPPTKGKDVMELGCGDGLFFEPLGFDQAASYCGIDLSQPMIERFRQRHPQADIRVGSAETFEPPRPVDLIFSHGVVQYFSHAKLTQHLELARTFLKPDGMILHTSIPWKALRREYELGKIWRDNPLTTKRAVGFVLRTFSASSRLGNIGYWLSSTQVRRSARRAGLSFEMFGSLAYPYRFHARFRAQDRQT